MADLTITSDTYKNLLGAADAAFGKIGNWMRNTISDNNTLVASNRQLGASLNEIEDRIKRVEALRNNTRDPRRIARLDDMRDHFEGQRQDIEDRSSRGDRWKAAGKKVLDGGIDQMVSGAPALLQMGMAAQTAQLNFEQLTGSAADAAAMMKGIRQMAASSLLDNDKLQENVFALKESGVAVKDLMPTLGRLGDVAGGDQTKMDSLTKGFAALQTDGYLTSEAMKAMTEGGFRPLQIMAEQTKIPLKQLQEDFSNHKITTEQVTAALVQATSEQGEFFGSMKSQSDTAAVKWHGLNEKVAEAGATIGNALMPTVSNFIDNTLTPLVNYLGMAADFIARNSDAIGALVTVVGAAILGYKAWTLAAELLGGAVAGSGVGLAITAIAALVGLVIWAWNTFGWFRGAVKAAWEMLYGFGAMVGTFLMGPIKGMISGISNIGQAVMHLFNGEWDQAWESGKAALKDLSGYNTAQTIIGQMKDTGAKASDAFQKEVNKKKGETKGPGLETPPAAPSNFAFGGGTGGGGGAAGGWDANSPINKISADAARKKAGIATAPGNASALSPENTRRKASLDTAKDTASGITNGGARSINLSLEKLFDTINITTNTIGEGITNMEQQVTDALLQILNKANATA